MIISLVSLFVILIILVSILVPAPLVSPVARVVPARRVAAPSHSSPLADVVRSILVRVVSVDLVPDLTAGLAPPELSAVLKAGVPVDAHLPAIDHLQVQTVKRLSRLVTSRVLDKTEATWRLLCLVQTHYQAHYLTTLREEVQQLLLDCVE